MNVLSLFDGISCGKYVRVNVLILIKEGQRDG